MKKQESLEKIMTLFFEHIVVKILLRKKCRELKLFK